MVMAEIINLIIPLDTAIPITGIHLNPLFCPIKGKFKDLQKTAADSKVLMRRAFAIGLQFCPVSHF